MLATFIGAARDLARPFSIYAGAVAVSIGAIVHPDVGTLGVAGAMAGGVSFLRSQDKQAAIKAGVDSEPGA